MLAFRQLTIQKMSADVMTTTKVVNCLLFKLFNDTALMENIHHGSSSIQSLARTCERYINAELGGGGALLSEQDSSVLLSGCVIKVL